MGYQAGQACHVAVEWMMENPEKNWKNGTLVLLSCSDIDGLIDKLEAQEVVYTSFREPDLNDDLTAIAILGHGNMFKRLPLMGK